MGEGVPEGCGVSLPEGDAVTEGVVASLAEGVEVVVGVSVAVVTAGCVASAVGVIVPPARPASASSDVAGRPDDTWLTGSRGAVNALISPPPACAVALTSSAEIGTPQARPAVVAIESMVRRSVRPAVRRRRPGKTLGITQL